MTLALLIAGLAGAQELPGTFHTAPAALPAQNVLLDVRVNGVARGPQWVNVADGRIGLSASVGDALGLEPASTGTTWLGAGNAITYELDLSHSALALHVPPAALQVQRIAPDLGGPTVEISPETWGAFVNYDLNARHSIGGGAGATDFGGLADVRIVGPDLLGSLGWAYDSAALGRSRGPIRLDSTITWRPEAEKLAVSLGDATTPSGPMSVSRSYRFAGVQVGTDVEAGPDWASAPVASLVGSAQAQSVLDLYLNGQRAATAVSAGGPYALTLPAAAAAGGASLLVTDVTGRSVLVPIEVPRVGAQLLRPGALRWSAGVGVPRFGFGTVQSRYAPEPYFYASGRIGATERLTVRSHVEGGPGLAMAEFGADWLATRSVALHPTVAVSRSARGVGASGRIALSAAGPWGLMLDLAAAHTLGPFDDVVSVSGRREAVRFGTDPHLTLPVESEMSARLT